VKLLMICDNYYALNQVGWLNSITYKKYQSYYWDESCLKQRLMTIKLKIEIAPKLISLSDQLASTV
jgi:hypothetical protein